MSILDRRKDLDFRQLMVCEACGAYGSYQVFMTYTVLSLFFIPCLKWNKHYYVQTSCCGMLYELDPEVGKRLAKGEQVQITPQNMCRIQNTGYYSGEKHCRNCGYTTKEDFDFCPKCGNRF